MAPIGGLVAVAGALVAGALSAFELHPALAVIAGGVPLALGASLAVGLRGQQAATVTAVSIIVAAAATGVGTARGDAFLYEAVQRRVLSRWRTLRDDASTTGAGRAST